MKYKQIGLTSLNCSVLSIGCLHFGVYLNEKESEDLILYSIDNGINFFDTGPLYGNGQSEKMLGKILKKHRKSILISTKAGLEKEIRKDGSFGVKVAKLTPQYLRKSLEKSLKEINSDYIDVFQLHAYDNVTPLEDTIGALEKLYDDGLIRSFGVSNFNPAQLKKINSLVSNTSLKKVAAIECHYNIIERKMETGVIPECVKNGVSLIPYRALARGILSGQYNSNKIPLGSRAEDSWRVRQWLKPEIINLVKEIQNLASNFNMTVAQFSLSWLLSKSIVCSAVLGLKSKKQLDQLLICTKFEMKKEIYDKIDNLISLNGESLGVMGRPDVYFEK